MGENGLICIQRLHSAGFLMRNRNNKTIFWRPGQPVSTTENHCIITVMSSNLNDAAVIHGWKSKTMKLAMLILSAPLVILTLTSGGHLYIFLNSLHFYITFSSTCLPFLKNSSLYVHPQTMGTSQ